MKSYRIMRHSLALIALCTVSVPAVAQVAPPPIEAYGELPTLERMALSPSGKLAMITTSNGKRVLAVLDETMKPVAGMEVGDIKVRDIEWVGDDFIALTRSDTQDLGERFIARNEEFWNAMIIPANGSGEVRTLFDDKATLNAFASNYGFRKVDGKWVGYFAGWPMAMGQRSHYYDGSPPALYAIDIASNKPRRVTSPVGADDSTSWLISQDGDVAATMEFNQVTGAWRILNSRGSTIASGTEAKGGGRVRLFNNDGTKAVFSIYPDDGETRYYEVPLDGSSSATRLFENVTIDSLYYDPNTYRLTGYRPTSGSGEEEGSSEDEGNESEADDPIFFDSGYQDTVGNVLKGFDAANGTMESYNGDFTRMLIRTSGNSDSGTWYLVDTSAGSASVIGRERPQIKGNLVGPISTITYKAQDGKEIEGILTLPPGREAKSLPLIILPHGGPRARDFANFDWWAQAFASRGYAVLQPNFRGSTGYGNDFMKAGNGEWGRKMQTDLSDGMDYLAQQGIVDPDRACIMGASYGGYAALAGVTIQQGKYKCSVSVAGVSDLKMMVDTDYNESGSKELREYWLELMGDRNALDDISPRRQAARADAPILLIHGRDDTVVSYRQSQVMADALKDAGKPYKLVELRKEDHYLSRSPSRMQMLSEALAFVEKYNPAD